MFADFREYYGLRLSDVMRFDGSLPIWEAALLAEQLPPTSRTFSALQGGSEYRGWSIDTYLMASLVDAMNMNSFLFAKANSKKRIKEPKLVPRPGDAERRKQERDMNPFAMHVKQSLETMKNNDKGAKEA
jgi:hypothetical protein